MTRIPVIVVSAEALSYSGTTWLNLVLGSHEKAFTLGPPDSVWNRRETGFAGANLVWRDKDTFWTGFDKYWDREENFLIALAHYAGVTHIIMDGPSERFHREVLCHPELRVLRPLYLRDARAITASFVRKNPKVSYLESILPSGWFYHSYQALQLHDGDEPKQVFYYEDCVSQPLKFLEQMGAYIGLEYSSDALRFWEHDHHITSGNQGTIALLRLAKGLPVNDFPGHDLYRKQLQKQQDNYLHGFIDDRWKDELSRLDRFYFDLILGTKHAELGYQRERFEPDEIRGFFDRHKALVADGKSVEIPKGVIERYIEDRATLPKSFAHQISRLVSKTKERTLSLATSLRYRMKRVTQRSIASKRSPTNANARRLDREPDSAPPISATKTELPSFPLPEHGTHYFDEIEPGMRESFRPYVVRPSGSTLDQVCEIVNSNIYHAHGPDYQGKQPYRIVSDTPSRYAELLEAALSIRGTRFLPARDLKNVRPKQEEIICHVRHDVDADIVGALQQARIEADLGITTTYYILHTAPYYGSWTGETFERHEAMAEIYCKIQDLGHEIALHTDGLGLYQFQGTNGAEGLKNELGWLRSLGLNITGSVTHNSFQTYGAENYAIFEGHSVIQTGKRLARAVAHEGRLALLQELNASELGLLYEGNEFFSQEHTAIQYYALRGMNDWRHQTYNSHLLSRPRLSTESRWCSQEDLIDQLGSCEKGVYWFFIVHPVYYGLRAAPDSPPVLDKELPAHPADTTLGWRGYSPGAISQRITTVNQNQSYQAVTKINDMGFADVPVAYVRNLTRRFIFLGKDQLATDRISVEGKAHHALIRGLRRTSGVEAGATALAGQLTPLSVRICWFNQLQPEAQFTDLVLSVGLSDLVTESSIELGAIWDLDSTTVDRLLPDDFASMSPSLVHELQGTGILKPSLSRVWHVLDTYLEALESEDGMDLLMSPASRRIERAVRALRSGGLSPVLLLEDCGETVGLQWFQLSADTRRRLTDHAGRWLRALAERCQVKYADPYAEMYSYNGLAQTHWQTTGLWSIHGHTLAANSLRRAFSIE